MSQKCNELKGVLWESSGIIQRKTVSSIVFHSLPLGNKTKKAGYLGWPVGSKSPQRVLKPLAISIPTHTTMSLDPAPKSLFVLAKPKEGCNSGARQVLRAPKVIYLCTDPP